jgi:hypothetical protein
MCRLNCVVKLYDRNKTLAFVLTFYKLGEELGYADMSCSKLWTRVLNYEGQF